VLAARGINNDMLAEAHVWDSGSIEMVNLAYFGETYTNNVWIHTLDYTVSEIGVQPSRRI
jgi:hypothetical protein